MAEGGKIICMTLSLRTVGSARPRPFEWATARVRGAPLDRRLAAGEAPEQADDLRRRARLITAAPHRRRLARTLERDVREAEGPPPWPDVEVPPLARDEIRAARAALLGLVVRLEDARPARPQGVARARLLITEPESPLYAPAPAGTLWAAARRAGAALDLEPVAAGHTVAAAG
jgi:hypothetical protein